MLCLGLLAASSPIAWIQLGALVAGAAGIAVVVQRRRAGGPRPQSIALTGQHAVHVVEAAGQRLVIGTGPGSAPSLLCRLDPPEPTPAAEPRRSAVAVRPLPGPSADAR